MREEAGASAGAEEEFEEKGASNGWRLQRGGEGQRLVGGGLGYYGRGVGYIWKVLEIQTLHFFMQWSKTRQIVTGKIR